MFGTNTVAKIVWKDQDASAKERSGEILSVKEIFGTIQGEGPFTGEPAIFVRLAGCNLRCHFCDTDFEDGKDMTIAQVVAKVEQEIDMRCETDLIVLTGGEPLRQQILPMLKAFDDKGWHIQIETAGTVWPPDILDPERIAYCSLEEMITHDVVELVCSPKTPKVHRHVVKHCQHFKYIIRHGEVGPDGLPIFSTQPGEHTTVGPGHIYRPDRDNVIPTIWLQPMEEYRDAGEMAKKYLATDKVQDAIATQRNIELCATLAMRHGYRVSLQTHKIMGVE